jgi:hypothetical protein
VSLRSGRRSPRSLLDGSRRSSRGNASDIFAACPRCSVRGASPGSRGGASRGCGRASGRRISGGVARNGGAGGGDITPLRAPAGARRVTRTRASRAPSLSTPLRGVLSTSIVTSSCSAPSCASAWPIAWSIVAAEVSIESLELMALRVRVIV